MFASRLVVPAALFAVTLLAGGCASMQAGQAGQSNQYASRDCKAVPADFVDRPKKNASSIEQTEARLKLGRLAAERGGYGGIGNNTLSDLARDCN